MTDARTLGICLPRLLPSGVYVLQSDRTPSQTSGKQFAVRRRVTDYLALSLLGGLQSYVNGPNVLENQQTMRLLVEDFMNREMPSPAGKGRITAFSVDIVTPNTPASIANGDFSIAVSATTPSPMERIFLLINSGPTVTITAQ